MLDPRRRQFITLLGGAAAWPLVARAQQPAMPVVGFLNAASSQEYKPFVAGFRRGLSEAGYVEGQNLAIEFRWAEGHYDRLPALATDLVRRRVAVIAANAPAAVAAKAATDTIPIVFTTSIDPIKLGLVSSLNRPAGNITGISTIGVQLWAKRLELLGQLVPRPVAIALLLNPKYPDGEVISREVQEGARTLDRQIHILNASTTGEIESAFMDLAKLHVGGLLVGTDAFFNSQREWIVALAARYTIPAMYDFRDSAVVGGLMSYGASLVDVYRQAANSVGKILKGEKPGNLPIQQPTKYELVINLKTAKALGLTVPDRLLALAIEVIE
jgi:putative ABC transport system substrate-binding protein